MMSEAGLSITLGYGLSMDDLPVQEGVHILMDGQGFYTKEGQQVFLTTMWMICNQLIQQ